MLNFCILDDNIDTVNKLSHMLESIFVKHDFEAKVTCKTSNIDELLSFVENNKVDVLLLDIELKSETTGLQIAEKIRSTNKDCYIIFTTAYLEYGLLAYRYKTFDYISKPITTPRLEDTIVRLFDDIKGVSKKFIRLDNKNTIIDENEVSYIKRDGMKIIFHTDSRDYEVYSSFNKLQNKLPDNFIRCHKSFIANVNNITKVEPSANLVYFNDSYCDIGPKYKNKFMEVINSYGNIE